MAPEQIRVITIGTEEPLVAYGKSIAAELREQGVRATGDYGSDKMQGKIADAEKRKVHTMLVLGNRDLEAGNVSVRLHGKGNVGAKKRDEVIANILTAIKDRRAYEPRAMSFDWLAPHYRWMEAVLAVRKMQRILRRARLRLRG